MWRTVEHARLTVIGLACSLLIISTPTVAQSREIIVNVCSDGPIGRLEITSPQSDTLLHASPVKLSGEAESIGQIEIYINGEYHKVIAIPRGDINFSTTIDLVAGTQAVEVRGVAVCDGKDLQDEVVVTYQPPPESTAPPGPSPGSRVPTVVSPTPSTGSQSGGGVVVSNPNQSDSNPDDSPTGSLFDWLVGLDWGSRLFRLTDIDSTAERLPTNWLRIGTFITGLGLLVAAVLVPGKRQDWRRNLRNAGVILVLVALLVVL